VRELSGYKRQISPDYLSISMQILRTKFYQGKNDGMTQVFELVSKADLCMGLKECCGCFGRFSFVGFQFCVSLVKSLR